MSQLAVVAVTRNLISWAFLFERLGQQEKPEKAGLAWVLTCYGDKVDIFVLNVSIRNIIIIILNDMN